MQEIGESEKVKSKTGKRFDILAIVCIIIIAIGITPKLLQNDTFYTIKIGEKILQTGIDGKDHFSWHQGLKYTYPHWLYDVMIYFIYSNFEFLGIYISSIFFASLLGIILYITNKKLSKNRIVSLSITIISMIFLRPYLTARAQLVTFCLFAIIIYCIEKIVTSKENYKKYGILIVLISILIVNLHVAVWPFIFILFLPYFAETILNKIMREYVIKKYIIKQYNKKINKLEKREKKNKRAIRKIDKLKEEINSIERCIEIKEENRKTIKPYKLIFKDNLNIKYLTLIFIICIFSGLITPLDVSTPYTYLPKTMFGTTVIYISEHKPMVLIDNANALSLITIFIGILMFTDVKIRIKDGFMLLGLTFLMLMSVRQFSMLVIIGTFIIIRLITSLFEKYSPIDERKIIKIALDIKAISLIIVIVIACTANFYADNIGKNYYEKSDYPIEVAKFIKNNLNVEEIRIYNEYNYGSYLIFEDIPVFIDSRAELYSPEFNGENVNIFNDCIDVFMRNKYYEEIFEKYDITHVLIQKSSKINSFLEKDENYEDIYSDDYFVIYSRNTKKNI